jgi:hypothetical protein
MVAILCVTFSPFLPHDPLIYELNDDGTYTVVGYREGATHINIPETYMGKPVTAIGDYAFEYGDFVSITIPNSITKIGIRPFESSNIETINYCGTKEQFEHILAGRELWHYNIGDVDINYHSVDDAVSASK